MPIIPNFETQNNPQNLQNKKYCNKSDNNIKKRDDFSSRFLCYYFYIYFAINANFEPVSTFGAD